MAVATCACLLFACASHDDEAATPATPAYTSAAAEGRPVWQLDLYGEQSMPTWADPDMTQFENSMFVLVKLQDELTAFSTDDDRMACFVDDKCRSVIAHPSKDTEGNIYFALKILGNASDRQVSIEARYYSGGLRQLFVLRGGVEFIAERVYGVDYDFVPSFLTGVAKYHVKMRIMADTTTLPVEPADDDILAAFVGGKCRGVAAAGEQLTVYGCSEGEQAELRYYSSNTQTIYTRAQTVPITADGQIHILKF